MAWLAVGLLLIATGLLTGGLELAVGGGVGLLTGSGVLLLIGLLVLGASADPPSR